MTIEVTLPEGKFNYKDNKMTKKEKDIVHISKEEIEKEVEVDFDTFMYEKKFNEKSPLQYTNNIVIEELALEAEAVDKGQTYDRRGFVGSAVKLSQTDYPKYRELMEKAGWIYDSDYLLQL